MNRRSRPFVLALPLLLAAAPAAAAIHKCRDADGQLSYQDQPCGADESLPAPRIDPPPAYSPPPAAVPAPAAPSAPMPPTPQVQLQPPPAHYRCTTYDGKHYVGTDPHPPGRYVPLVALDFEGTHRYRRGDIVRRGSQQALAVPRSDPYVYVEDQCVAMGPRELCVYWKQQFEDTRHRRKLAFNDTRPQLEQQEAGLRDRLAAHCGQ